MFSINARIIVLLSVCIFSFVSGFVVNGWRAGAREKAAVEAARAAERQAQQSVIDSLKNDIRVSQESSNAYQAELTRLRNTPIPIPSVRVCKSARSPAPDLPTPSTTTSRPDASSEAGRVVPQDDSERIVDIGPVLEIVVSAGDECSAQLRGLQDWIVRTR